MDKQTQSCSTIRPMERAIRALAGTFVTASVILGYFISPYWFILTLFVGLNLLQSSMTRWCMAEQIFDKLGIATKAYEPKSN